MDVSNLHSEGSLHISTDVLSKITQMATAEVEGVHAVSVGSTGVKNLFGKAPGQRPIIVTFNDGIAEILVHVIVLYGYKIPQLSEKVQENVKSAVQSMTGIMVSKVNIVIAGVVQEASEPTAAE